MSSFHDVRFPLPLAFGASGGPVRQTDIVTLASGHEQRNTSQAFSRRRYDAGVGVKSLEDMQVLVRFFEARFGQLHSFRFRDPIDHNSAPTGENISTGDQLLGKADGVMTEFQLTKNYGVQDGACERIITKPVNASVIIAVGGVVTSGFYVNPLTGLVTFQSPPQAGKLVTAGFEFDVPVRFDTEHLSAALESFGAGGAVHVPLLEVLAHA